MEATYEKRSKRLAEAGKSRRFIKGENRYPNKTYHRGNKHFAWKGEEVSYRGLHYWVRRNRGEPPECQWCSETKTQWANIDRKYRRNLDDFIALCVSCHNNFDRRLEQ